MKSLSQVIRLQELLFDFYNLERTLLLPAFPGKEDRNETDAEHSYSLAIVAWYLSQDIPHLDSNKCMRYALVHDLLEVYSGDTFAYDKDASAHATKADREQKAIARLREEWPDFSDMHEGINEYEARSNAESRFVYALDKLMPMIVNYVSKGKNYRAHGITLNDVKKAKAEKVALSPEVNRLYGDLIRLFEDHPEFFR